MTYEVTMQTFLRALRHRYRQIVLTVLGFTAIGLLFAFLYADQGAAEATGGAEPLLLVELEASSNPMRYVRQAKEVLRVTSNHINRYASALLADDSLSEAQRQSLEAIYFPFQSYYEDTIIPLLTTPIKQFPPMEESMVTIDVLNALSSSLSACADQICRENHLLFMLEGKYTGVFAPTIHHGNRFASEKEAAEIIILLTALVGLCSGCFFAVCAEAKKAADGRLQ